MLVLAMDRAGPSVRRFDVDGRLHVETSNISKANVCPYLGVEIPGYQELGLAADQVYMLLRDPDELRKAAPSFNNLPVLNRHVAVTADDHQPEFIVGSTGTNAVFDGEYLTNSSVIWARDSINLIENHKQRQWSCGYRYTPDMTPGIFKGLRYDGVMRNILGNHVALVEAGRAGPDVVVGDEHIMAVSRKGLMLSGAIAALVRPLLAADAQIDFSSTLNGVTGANMTERKATLAAAVVAMTTPLLARDAALDADTVAATIDAVAGTNLGAGVEDEIATDAAPPATVVVPPAPVAVVPPAAAVVPPAPAPVDVAQIAADAANSVRDHMNALRDAERAVFPFIGALDSTPDTPAAVYKLALDAAKVDLVGIDPSAYGAMLRMLPKPGTVDTPHLAADAVMQDASADFGTRFPGATKLIRS